MFGFITQIITLLCCNLYPIFASFKAIRNRDGDEYSRWFIYWIMFSLFLSVTYVTDWLLWWVPFYEVLKLCIALWLLPFFKGSKILYTGLVHPHLMENEQQIDLFVNSISSRLLTLGRVLFSFAIQKTTEAYAAQTFAANLPALHPAPAQQPPPSSGMQYPPQQPPPPSGMEYPSQQLIPPSGMQYTPQQQPPSSGMQYPPQQQPPSSGMQYPPQQQPPSSGMQYPPQQPPPPSGMQYPTESLPPTYTDMMTSEVTTGPARRGDFSDDEDTGRAAPVDSRVFSLRDETPSSAPVSPHHADTSDTSEARLRDTHKQTERPRSEHAPQQPLGSLSRQKSPGFRATRSNTEADLAERKRSARQAVSRQSTIDSARQKKSQEK